MIVKRNIALYVVLSLITCGIFPLVWLYTLTEDTNKLTGDATATSGGMVLLFSIITCSIYEYFWLYRQGEIIDHLKAAAGKSSSNTGVIYLILGLVGLGIVSYALMQNELNNLAE